MSLLSNYCCDRALPSYEVTSDNWYVPNIWGDGEVGDRYDGWLNKPQYRIVKIQLTAFPYAVFNETVDRTFVGFFSTVEDAHNAGEKACAEG